MKKINKKEPPFFNKFIDENNPKTWSDCIPMAHRLRKHMLINEQYEKCAYCEQAITPEGDKSHIDHFRRKAGHLFPELEFVYNNLYVSCISDEHCGRYKDRKLTSKEEFKNLVNPSVDNPKEHFTYIATGEIKPLDNKGKFTIDSFKLNAEELVNRRKTIAIQLPGLKNQFTVEEIKKICFIEFHSFIDYLWETLNALNE